MIDQSKWKYKDVWVSSLQLDSRNPRIPTTAVSQAELIADLIENEGVYDLAKDIAEQGYYKLKNIIVFEEDGKTIVLEGNRRVTALKLLLSYKQAPSAHRARFKRLSDKASLKQIKRIPAIVVPSREAAAPIILREHTISQIKGWSPVMQARFYFESLKDGVTIAELVKEYSITPGEIKGFLQSYEMYRIACSLDLPPAVAAKVRARNFPLSTLDRIYSKPEVAAVLGIEFDDDKRLVGKIDLAEFKKGYARIVSDVATETVNSRNLNGSAEFSKYIKELAGDTPDLKKKGEFTASTILDPKENKAASAPREPSVKPPKPAPPLLPLIPKSYVVHSGDQRITAIIKELQKVSARDYPNAVASLLRVLVDITVGLYCDEVGVTKPILDKARTKDNKPQDWYPTVRQLLKGLINSPSKGSFHPLVLKAAQKLVADEDGTITIMTLDAFAHNRFVTPTEGELRSIWVHLEESIKIMAESKPQKPTENV